MNLPKTSHTLDWLFGLYAENYQRILALAPVRELPCGRYVNAADGHPPLLLDVLEQQPYTSQLRLSLGFTQSLPAEDPEAYWRVYHDARQAEVTHCRFDAHRVRLYSPHTPARQLALYRRRMNAFANKWLEHLHESGYGQSPWVAQPEAAVCVTVAQMDGESPGSWEQQAVPARTGNVKLSRAS